MLNWLYRICMLNRGNPILCNRAGDRGESAFARQWYALDAPPMLMGCEDNQCAKTALVNGIDLLGQEDEAMIVAHNLEVPKVRDIRDLCSWIQASLGRYQLSEKETTVDGSKNLYNIERMGQINEGIWIVNQFGTHSVNHVICIDMYQKLIFDGYEEFPMVYTREALACCVGDESEMISSRTRARRLTRKPE